MTQEQRHELLGVSKSTFSDWKKPNHPKHNLYLLIKNMSYTRTKNQIQKFKELENKST